MSPKMEFNRYLVTRSLLFIDFYLKKIIDFDLRPFLTYFLSI